MKIKCRPGKAWLYIFTVMPIEGSYPIPILKKSHKSVIVKLRCCIKIFVVAIPKYVTIFLGLHFVRQSVTFKNYRFIINIMTRRLLI